MRYWLLAIGLQVIILALGLGLQGASFVEVQLLHAPVVNLLLWTGLVSLAGLAASAARRRLHRGLGLALVILAVSWFPISLLIFGNARFSGTSYFLWQLWLSGTATLVIASVLSLSASSVAGLAGIWRNHRLRE
ncbi:hypothetical protein IC757_15505 [Wenzhouxiangella sp. AB-CW3]|uniref:hypothetical protein n=1 Tax=Wenzhouxiangella sp. AB-CW3 TaxID=2771012 RepID=UPI00168A997D|nr:hypothetical protein [Wenzhouxiangella sp. AB-CW3]QOC22394.1 hypothetical protein IC757_15505 [Wenzhouxiangella sp. AB-CW3]